MRMKRRRRRSETPPSGAASSRIESSTGPSTSEALPSTHVCTGIHLLPYEPLQTLYVYLLNKRALYIADKAYRAAELGSASHWQRVAACIDRPFLVQSSVTRAAGSFCTLFLVHWSFVPFDAHQQWHSVGGHSAVCSTSSSNKRGMRLPESPSGLSSRRHQAGSIMTDIPSQYGSKSEAWQRQRTVDSRRKPSIRPSLHPMRGPISRAA